MFVLQGTTYAAQLVAGSDLTGASASCVATAPDGTSQTYTGTVAGTVATANIPAAQIGTYLLVWTVSGTAAGGVVDQFTVRAPRVELMSITDLRSELNIGDTARDEKLRGWLAAAGELIENITGPIRPTVTTELFDGGGSTVVLRAHLVSSVTSVTEWQGTTARVLTAQAPGDPADGYGYTWNRTINAVTRRSSVGGFGRFASGGVQVVYVAGLTSIPGDVQLACARLVGHWFRKNETPFRAGSFTGTADDAVSMPGNYMVPNEVMELLEPWRRPPGFA